MKWMIISTIVTIPLLFVLPPDNSSFSDQYSQSMMAQIRFDEFCSNLPVRDCTAGSVRSVYLDCTTAYGNLTLEQCMAKCCNINTYNLSDFFGITVP